jgi:hypothetical protein
MKKSGFICTVAVLFLSLGAFAERKDEVTLMLVPREDSVVRVGLDIASRYPTLLISYKLMPNNAVSLHGWNGKEWVNVSKNDFREGNFFRTGPDSALIVEAEDAPLPVAFVPSAEWCESVYKITTTETRPLLHLIGQYYDFKYKDWQWFSENYNMSMEAINPEGLNVSWYHKRFQDNLKKGPVAADDLQYWVALRYPVVVVAQEEVVAEEEVVTEEVMVETEVTETDEQPEMELPEDPDVNPLTNAVPSAVVLGAGDADEAVINE